MASPLNSHINSSHTLNDYQSAYRKFHSTETALLKIHNDILSSMDDGKVTALTLLDLSAAFNTIDHTILLSRLGNWFGVNENERQWSKYLSMFPIELLGVETYPAKSAHNLGVIFDKKFNFRSHISAICSSCIYHIRDLRRIRHHLDLDGAKLLANALVSSRFDYCNSLLSGIAETDLTKLQRVLNRLARVVTKSPTFTHSVPLLRSLHWLPVKYRVNFKICLLIYKALHEEQPVYLCFLIAISLPSCSLRSNRGITVSIPRIKTNTGTRAFSSCAPSLWNNLPLSVRSATSVATFRRCLKTYLFDLASPIPRRHRCALLPVDVTERLQRLCI